MQVLEGDAPIELGVVGEVHAAHAPSPWVPSTRGRSRVYCLPNQLYRHLRKHIGKRDVDFTYESLADMNTSPPSRLINDERKLFLLDALRTLPLEQQLLIELYYWEDIAIDSLATVFEIAAPTVRTRLFRARAALRDKMEALATEARGGEESEASLEEWARSLRAAWEGSEAS